MFKIIKKLNHKEWVLVFISILFIVAQVWLDLKLPDYMAEITRLTQTPGSEMADIWRSGLKMLLCALGSLGGAIIVGYFSARIAASVSQRLRSELFSKVDSFSMAEINKFSTDSLITRSTNDITQIQLIFTMGLQLIVKAPIMAVWALIKIYGKGLEWSIVTGGTVAILIIYIAVMMAFIMPKFKKMQILTDGINRVTREGLTGIRVVRAYNAEEYQENKFESVNTELTNAQLFTSRGMAVLFPLISMMLSGLSLGIYWVGAYLINAADGVERLDLFSNMVVFSSYAVLVIMSFMMMIMLLIMMPRASVSAKRINEVLATEISITSGKVKNGVDGREGEIIFENVSFKYPEASDYILKNINFTAKKGETVAIIGSTGSGKTTLINLITRFFDVSSGKVLVDGVDVREYDLPYLYNKIGYVPQKTTIFKGTVRHNVDFGYNGKPKVNDQELEKAIDIAQATDIVAKMTNKLDAEIAQGGTNLSGGQKQRFSIARAVCRQPEIYIFDDSFSALDYKTDRKLRSVLKEETKDVTSLIVAQRIGTIINADKIIVLSEGEIVGQGTHRDLLASCTVYKEIAMSQLSEEELAQ